MQTILLKLAGPMQSWGTGSHFETRHTDFHPSKSAIIGLVAASLGYRRDDEKIKSLNALDFAVRVDQQGSLLRDYHTAMKNKKDGSFDRTYVTNRYYLEDAIFLVALGSNDNKLIEKIAHALKNPYFQGYLGRRSLPLTADFFQGVLKGDVLSVLSEASWYAKPWYRKSLYMRQQNPKLIIYADASLISQKGSSVRRDRVLSFSQKERRFAYRGEGKMEIEVFSSEETKHDAFSALGG